MDIETAKLAYLVIGLVFGGGLGAGLCLRLVKDRCESRLRGWNDILDKATADRREAQGDLSSALAKLVRVEAHAKRMDRENETMALSLIRTEMKLRETNERLANVLHCNQCGIAHKHQELCFLCDLNGTVSDTVSAVA